LLTLGYVVGCKETIIIDRFCSAYDCSKYASLTAPESLLTNLQHSYNSRSLQHYMELLAPEYVFKFQPVDANEIGTPTWTRDEDSTGTRALLTTTEISGIRISFTYGPRDSSVDLSPPVDSLRIRILAPDLQIDETDGVTWVVLFSQQDFFFRKGLLENGEDPERWLIYEWDDLPAFPSPSLPGTGTTWGKLKTMYVLPKGMQ
jgi:hypothetical protein